MVKYLVIFSVLLASTAAAQTHPCDLPAQTGQITVGVNVPFTLSWCHNGKDASGAPVSITGWKIVRNTDAPINVTPTATATKNAAGLTGFSLARTEATVGSVTYQVYAVNGTTDGGKASITFTVQVGALVAPTNLRVVP